MKNGYRRLLLFESIIFIALLSVSLGSNILSGFKMTIFLGLVLLYFNNRFGFEKGGLRYRYDVLLDAIIYLLAFFLIYYLSGLIFGFAKNDYLNPEGMLKFTLPPASYIVMREYARFMFLCKSEGSRLATATTVFLFIALDLCEKIYFANLSNGYNIFLFVALSVLPTLSSNIVLSYISKKVGFVVPIIYSLALELYRYIIPIVPNPNEYISSLIAIITPVVFGYMIYAFFRKTESDILPKRFQKSSVISLACVTGITLIMAYFISGYFDYWIIAVASGSMSGAIEKGDLALIEKVESAYDDIEIEDIIAYDNDGTIVVHRVIAIERENGKLTFKTKGDANEEVDSITVSEKMVIGIVKKKIPYLGWPALWLNNL